MAALAAVAPGLAACGFRPVYGDRAGRHLAAEMAAIRVDPIPERLGQILRNDLIDRLSPTGEPAQPRYRLRVNLIEARVPLAIQSDTTITRFNLRLDATFALVDAATGEVLYRDRARAVGSYNAVVSDFATLAGERDTARRAARSISDEVQTLLAVYFARRTES